MHLYALYYYRQAQRLRYAPYVRAMTYRTYDSRMWSALGLVYKHIGRFGEAVKVSPFFLFC